MFVCHWELKTGGRQAHETPDLNTAVKESLCPAVSKYSTRPWQQLNATAQVEHILPTGILHTDPTSKCQKNIQIKYLRGNKTNNCVLLSRV